MSGKSYTLRQHYGRLTLSVVNWTYQKIGFIKSMDIENTIAVTLKFSKKMAFRVYDEFTDDVTEDEQGNLYVQTKLPCNDALYSYLFSFADYVEVIEPQSVREQVTEKLAAMQKKYIT